MQSGGYLCRRRALLDQIQYDTREVLAGRTESPHYGGGPKDQVGAGEPFGLPLLSVSSSTWRKVIVLKGG